MDKIQPFDKLSLMLQSDQALLLDTALQLEKDLRKTGWEGSVISATAIGFEELKRFLEPILKGYFDVETERFFRLIYIVDLPESKVKAILRNPEPFRDLTQMIISRECMKVILRRNL